MGLGGARPNRIRNDSRGNWATEEGEEGRCLGLDKLRKREASESSSARSSPACARAAQRWLGAPKTQVQKAHAGARRAQEEGRKRGGWQLPLLLSLD